MSASRGAEQMPDPSRSSKRAPKYRRPHRGCAHQWLADRGHEVAEERDRLSLLQLIRQSAGKALDNVLRGLSEIFHKADDAAGRVQRLRQKDRQNRIEHFRRNVSEQAGKGQKKCVSRQP